MSAIDQLKIRLTGLKQNRHAKEEDLALHKKCVLGIKAEINKATEEISEYESAISLLENVTVKQFSDATTIVGDESCEVHG